MRRALPKILGLMVSALLLAPPLFAQTKLQAAMEAAFSGENGAAVVLRVSDGKVLAQHGPRVLEQRIATPGSTIKPFTLELLLEKGAVNPQQALACHRPLTIGGHDLSCSHAVELSSFTAEEALAYSCNTYFVTAAARLAPGELERRFAEIGFARPSGLMAEEGAGKIVAARTLADRQLLAVGAVGVEVTPMELAAAYLQLARIDAERATAAQRVVLAGLRGATDYGLARGAKPAGLSVAGKTGTAAAANDARTHAWFAGFAPAEKPEIVVVVFLERGRGGAEAATVARRIFAAWAEERK